MSGNSYDQFFKSAQKAKRQDVPQDRVRLSPQAAAKPKVSAPDQERSLRRAVRMNKPKAPFPWKAVVGLVGSLVLATCYLLSPETFDKALGRIEFRVFGQAEAADSAKNSEAKPAEKSTIPTTKGEKPATNAIASGKGKSLDEKSGDGEDLSHYEKLKQRKEELDVREKELAELEEELQRQKVELDKRITQLDEMRNQIAQTLKDRVEVDQEKVNKLVDLYSNMKPKQAADVIGSLNEELAVEVLAKMKKKNAAEIMNLLTPDKSRVLSEKYTGYRRISSQDAKGQ